METGTSILSYKGDAGKALGSSRDVTVIGPSDTTALGQTARELALASFGANQQLYRQRIADRDAIFKMLEDDKINPGAVLEEDRPLVDDAKKKVLDAFYNSGGDIMNDPKKHRDFIKLYDNARATATQAQKRYVGVTADLAEKQKFQNPFDQEKIDAHVAQQKGKGFWGVYDPFAPITHYNLDTVNKTPLYGPTEVTHEGDYDITRQKLDTAATFNEYQKQWAQPTQTHWFNEYVNQFLTGPNAANDVARINAGIDRLNERLGLKQGQNGYVDHLKVGFDRINGQYVPLGDRPDQIAAKIAMADSTPVLEKQDFAKDRVNAQINKGELAERIRNDKDISARDWARINQEKKYKDFLMENGGSKTSAAQRDESLTWATNKIDELKKLGIPQKDGSVFITPDKLNRIDPQLLEMLNGVHVNEEGKKVVSDNSILQAGGGTTKGFLGIGGGEAKGDAVYITKDGKIRKVPSDAYVNVGGGTYKFDNRKTVELPDVIGVAYNYLKDKSIFLKGAQLGASANIDTEGESGSQYNQKTTTKGPQFKSSYTTSGGKSVSLSELQKAYSPEKIKEYIDNGILK